MPDLKKHCKNSEERTGNTYEDLHKWMDEPGSILGLDHRRVRHDLSYIEEVKKKFGKNYGEPQAVKEFLLHISEDYKDSAENFGKKCKTEECYNQTYKRYPYCYSCYKKLKK